MFTKLLFFRTIAILLFPFSIFASCDKSSTSSMVSGNDTPDNSSTVTCEQRSVNPSPLQGIDGATYWEAADRYLYAMKTAATLEPPSNLQVNDRGDDNGHGLKLSWILSPSEEDSSVAWYRIFRSRSETLTEPVLLSRFTSVDSLNSWDAHYTILIDSVAAGIHDYEDCVPLNGVPYYYWLQAVGSAAEPAVAGTVKDQNDNPVEGVMLRLYNADTSVYLYAISDSDGNYAFYNVPPGEYYLVAKKDNYQIFSTMVIVE